MIYEELKKVIGRAIAAEQALKICQNIFVNLKPGSRFVTINNNSEQPPASYLLTEKYGFIKSIDQPLQEGTPIQYTISIDTEKFSFYNYCLSKSTYEWALQSAGFKEVRWQKPLVSPEGVEEFGQEFWQVFLEYAPIVFIECS